MFTPEQLVKFAEAGWGPDAIKEMLEYDTEVKGKIENGDDIDPNDVGNHIDDPKPEEAPKDPETQSAETIIDNLLNGGN